MADLPLETLSEIDPAVERDPGPPQPYLFRVLECQRPLAPSARHGLGALDAVVIGRGERSCDRGSSAGRELRLGVPDPWMSSTHARLSRRGESWIAQDAGSRNGTLVNGAPAQETALADGDLLEIGRTFFLFRAAAPRLAGDPDDLESSMLSPMVPELASLSLPLAQQLRRLIGVTDSAVSVVVQGETGTGKERIAHAVHVLSRRPGAFVAVNCGALPDTLIETELFGCRRGAFTGAQDRPGLVRTADRGTLFLDEIGDLPHAAQVALLRVLQERQVHPVGATHPVPVDFRMLCATQVPLDALVKAGKLRPDLISRLAGVTMHLPPLRERREDLGIITATLIRRLCPEPAQAESVTFDKDAARALLRHPFPLNIRELEKCLEGAIALAAGGPIRTEHLQLDLHPSWSAPGTAEAAAAAAASAEAAAAPAALSPADLELRDQLVALLDQHGGNLSATARAMGKERVQIRRWLRRYQIDPAQFRR